MVLLSISAARASQSMNVQRFLHRSMPISTWAGKAAAWLIIVLTAMVCVEVFKRYVLNAPTAWIFDANNMLYGTLFMMAGAYALAQNAHVRGDFLYGSMRPRTQAALDLVLYIVFFLPGIAALLYAGYRFAGAVVAHRRAFERHGRGAADLSLQDDHSHRRRADHDCRASPRSCAASCACAPVSGRAASRTSPRWTCSSEQLAQSEHVDDETRKRALEGAQKIDETARQRGMTGDLQS